MPYDHADDADNMFVHTYNTMRITGLIENACRYRICERADVVVEQDENTNRE